jgi:cell division septation protein DedD
MTQDRRLHPRLIPDSALLVSVDRLRRAFLSDLSEGGMAFDGLVVEGGPSVVSVGFNLPDGGGAIEAIAEVVWTCESRHRTGVRFLELAEECRKRLREWLSARVVSLESPQGSAVWDSLSEITGAARNWILEEIGESGAPEQAGQPAESASKAREPNGKPGVAERLASYRSAGVALGLIVVCSACVTIGYYLPALSPAPKTAGHISTIESPARFASNGSITSVSESSGATSVRAVDLPGKYEGFVLQVGAMAHQENAEALAKSLQQKNFPAFVFDRAGDGLYRVDVGPYPDAKYAHDVKNELTSAGFRKVLERQLPR